ncbi:zinc finger and SCAN domain-containing protein 21 isoform X2 [Diachasma alloeum]|uniref:zinc finger and SCAN domain-containing protein 21 isoform X2 n=1 Tax=Diachasma alloeum TaxID=454923 RepID=UPI0007384D6C|nr:zinc finger and SCAN domain-containing protein 21 isoform X2 [Diachasma alloeum]
MHVETEMTTVGVSELICLICRSPLEISSSINIFYTSLPRSGELLASFVLGTIRPSVTDLQSSYLCSQCYNLFQMLEQAQCTVTNIQNEILKTYTLNENRHISKHEIRIQENGGISAIDNHSIYQIPQVQNFELLNHETVEISSTNNCSIEESQKDLQLKLNLPEIPNGQQKNGSKVESSNEGSLKDNKILEPSLHPQPEILENNESRKSEKISRTLEEPLKHSCPICDKRCKTSAELKTHIASHSSVRPYMCEKCGQAYKHKHALKIHIGMHNGISPFKCSFCDKCFTQKGALMRHLPMHTGEMPYQCDLCGKRFVHHTSYNMHVLSHTGKKSYQCHVCNASLLSTSHLKRHMRVHTGEKPFSCDLCDETNVTNSSMGRTIGQSC